MKSQRHALLVLTALMVSGCLQTSADESGNPATVLTSESTWVLAGLTVEGDQKEADGACILSFTESEFSGRMAVESFRGTYEARTTGDLKLKLEFLGAAEIAVEPAVLRQQEEIAKVLRRVNHFEATDTGLLLSDGSSKSQLRFAKYGPSPSLPLRGTTWTLTIFEEFSGTSPEDSVSATPAPRDNPIFLQIKADNVTGSGGCNRIDGSVRVEKNERLEFLNLSVTEEGGPSEALKVETEFIDKLLKVSRFTVTGNRLVLSNDDGTLALHFEGKSPENGQRD